MIRLEVHSHDEDYPFVLNDSTSIIVTVVQNILCPVALHLYNKVDKQSGGLWLINNNNVPQLAQYLSHLLRDALSLYNALTSHESREQIN